MYYIIYNNKYILYIIINIIMMLTDYNPKLATLTFSQKDSVWCEH